MLAAMHHFGGRNKLQNKQKEINNNNTISNKVPYIFKYKNG
jgi:hypothetical protein